MMFPGFIRSWEVGNELGLPPDGQVEKPTSWCHPRSVGVALQVEERSKLVQSWLSNIEHVVQNSPGIEHSVDIRVELKQGDIYGIQHMPIKATHQQPQTSIKLKLSKQTATQSRGG